MQEFGFVNKALDQMGKLKIHAICVALFLVFGHIAMIAGMLDPALLGYKGADAHQMGASPTNHEYCDPAMHGDMKVMHEKMHQQMMNSGSMPSGNPNPMPMNSQGHSH
jgi:hypothetical protein